MQQSTKTSPVLFGQLDNSENNNIDHNNDNNSDKKNDSNIDKQIKNTNKKTNINNLQFYRHALHAAGQSAKAKSVRVITTIPKCHNKN